MSDFSSRAHAWVQPIVVTKDGLHVETIAAVASASVAVRSQPHEHASFPVTNYEQWLAGPFTKTVRRASARDVQRLVEWACSEGVPHMVVAAPAGDGTVVAFPPMQYADLPKLVAKAQVRGTDFAPGDSLAWTHPAALTVLVDNTLTTGKAAAAAAHAAWAWMLDQERRGVDLSAWREAGSPVTPLLTPAVVLAASARGDGVYPIVDRGLTEVEPDTLTAVALPLTASDA